MATTKITPAPLTRPLSDIAREIQRDYVAKGKEVYFAARPYVEAMRTLHGFEDKYFEDGAEEIVIKLLGNLSTWRGEVATRVRGELKAALADYQQEKAASQGRHPAGRRRPQRPLRNDERIAGRDRR